MSRLNRHFAFHDQNSHFTNQNERDLIRGMHQEAIQINGYEIVYAPLEVVNVDRLWGEDVNRKFTKVHRIPAWVQTFEGFNPGGPDPVNPYGWMPSDEVILSISSKEFKEIITDRETPKEGDIILFELVNKVFEVKWVEHEEQFYPLAQQMCYVVRCRELQYTHEELATEDENLNKLEDQEFSGEEKEDIPEHQGENQEISDSSDDSIDWTEKSPFGRF